jgi:hypothetical protein
MKNKEKALLFEDRSKNITAQAGGRSPKAVTKGKGLRRLGPEAPAPISYSQCISRAYTSLLIIKT